jgi:hypothetical protein
MEQLHATGFTRRRDTRKLHEPGFRAIVFERPPVKLLILHEDDNWTVEMSLDDWEISQHVRFPLSVRPDEPSAGTSEPAGTDSLAPQ